MEILLRPKKPWMSLRRSLTRSKLLPGSVVVFDGFTGFTPIQNRLIQEIMRICDETIVTITMGIGENPYELDEEQRLFHLSKKTVADLTKLAGKPVWREGKIDLFCRVNQQAVQICRHWGNAAN